VTVDPTANHGTRQHELLMPVKPSPALLEEPASPAAPTPVVRDNSIVLPAASVIDQPPAVEKPIAAETPSASNVVRKTRPLLPKLFSHTLNASPVAASQSPKAGTNEPSTTPTEYKPSPAVLVESPASSAVPPEQIRITRHETSSAPAGNAPQMIFNTAATFQHEPPPPVLIESPPSMLIDSPPMQPLADPSVAPIVPASGVTRPSHLIADWRNAEPVAPIVPAPPSPSLAPNVSVPADEHDLAPIVSPDAVRRGVMPVRTSN
jgi:hypothetical protein